MNKAIIDGILEIVNVNLSGINESNIDDDLSQVGMDSIAFIQTVVMLEEKFNIEIPDELLILSELNTVNKIYIVIKELLEG